jgi:hypothetical protein
MGGYKSWNTRVKRAKGYKGMAKREFKNAGRKAGCAIVDHFTKGVIGAAGAVYHGIKGFTYRRKVRRLLNK